MTAVDTTFASPVDVAAFGSYRINRPVGDTRPTYRFVNRIGVDDSEVFPARPGVFHIYAGWFCPWAQRTTIVRELAALQDVVSVSYVDGARDARGWAFRETNGPDPVNGFALLRDAYEATEPGFDGHVSVPTLWSRADNVVVSNNYRLIGIDLATKFGEFAGPGAIDTYPLALRARIDDLDRWLGPVVNWGVNAAAGSGEPAEAARRELLGTFEELDTQLTASRYLLGDAITEADVRLWVTLVRFDVQANAARTIVSGLDAYPNLWAYARDLYSHPAFQVTTRFEAFTSTGATRPDWDAPHGRGNAGE
ncbi:MAG: Glutathione S-transferase [Pseudonocardiales bacterium]|nr:Glutathione S-transferase [Pseudonocardiales bacterium]